MPSTQIDKWIPFFDTPALPPKSRYWMREFEYTFEPNVLNIPVSWDFLPAPEIPFSRRPQTELGVSPHIDDTFFSYSPVTLDWFATSPDPMRRTPTTHEGYSVWHITDFIAALDWLHDAEVPRWEQSPLADYGNFAIPGDPLNPQLTPQPHIEATVVWPASVPLPTDVADVATDSLALDAIEWLTAIDQPFKAKTHPWPVDYSNSMELLANLTFADWLFNPTAPQWQPKRFVDYSNLTATQFDLTAEMSFTWLQNIGEPQRRISSAIATDQAYVPDKETILSGSLGWQQPFMIQQWPDVVNVACVSPFLSIELSTEPESGLRVDNQNVDGR